MEVDCVKEERSLELEGLEPDVLMGLLLKLSQRFGDRDAEQGKAIDVAELPGLTKTRYRVSWITTRRLWPNYWGYTPEDAVLNAVSSFAPEFVARCLRVVQAEAIASE